MVRGFVVLSFLGALNLHARQPLIGCETRLAFYSQILEDRTDHGWYVVKGPALKARQFAPYDGTSESFYGDTQAFHANGLTTPDINTQFLASISYQYLSDISIRVEDRRHSTFVAQNVSFSAKNEHSVALPVVSQEKLVVKKRYGDDELRSITVTCKRSP